MTNENDLIRRDEVLKAFKLDSASTDKLDVYITQELIAEINAIPAVSGEPVAYNHHFIQDDDFMPEEVLSHYAVIPVIMGCKYAGKTDNLYTTPQDQSARIAELEYKLLQETIKTSELEAQLARYECVGYVDIAKIDASKEFKSPFAYQICSQQSEVFNTKLFALKD